MELKIDSSLYNRLQTLKLSTNNSGLSDVEFLFLLVQHAEDCGLKSERSSHNKYVNGSSPPMCIKPEQNDQCTECCPECKFAAGTRQQLLDHFEMSHFIDGYFPCTCGFTCGKLSEFLGHYMDCPVAATDLQDTFSHQGAVKRKRMSPSLPPTVLPTEPCDTNCDRSSPELYHSYRHPSVSPVAGPSDDKPYGCPKCLKGFKSKSLLDQHMHLHYPPRYKCRWCGNVYRWPPVYYHHKQRCKKRPVHSPPENLQNEPLNGQTSGAITVSTSNDNIDLPQCATTHLMSFSTLPIQPKVPMEELKPIIDNTPPCPLTCFCNEIFYSIQLYIEHISNCPRAFPASRVLENLALQALMPLPNTCLDLSTQNKPIKEEPKSVPVTDLSTYKEIISRSISVNGIFSCSICGKDFNSKLSLKQHVDGKHRAEGKYLCPTCGKRYRWGASFYYHKKNCIALDQSENIDTKPPELLLTRT